MASVLAVAAALGAAACTPPRSVNQAGPTPSPSPGTGTSSTGVYHRSYVPILIPIGVFRSASSRGSTTTHSSGGAAGGFGHAAGGGAG